MRLPWMLSLQVRDSPMAAGTCLCKLRQLYIKSCTIINTALGCPPRKSAALVSVQIGNDLLLYARGRWSRKLFTDANNSGVVSMQDDSRWREPHGRRDARSSEALGPFWASPTHGEARAQPRWAFSSEQAVAVWLAKPAVRYPRLGLEDTKRRLRAP